jgi:ankyrin repeat protein
MARLYMDFLENLTSLKDVREALQSLPEEVTEFYQEAWSRIEQQRGGLRQLAQQAIYWLSSALTQLTIDQLRVALAVRNADRYLEIERLPAIDVLIQVCQGLVQVDSESKIIRLVHFTTQEFFDAIRSQSFPDIHKKIASTCLTYLTFDEFKNGPCKFISTRALDMGKTEGEIKSSNVLARRIARNPLLIYVVHHWGHHACMAPEEVLEPEILSFLAMPQNVASAIQAQYVGSQWPYDSELNAPGSLALHVAVCFGLRHTAKILLEPMSSNEVNLLDCRRKTALHWAVESGSTKMALLLLQAGADLNTPIRGESNEYVKLIMGIGPNSREIRWRVGGDVEQDVIAKRDLVYIAVESDQEELLAAWTERGADSSIVKERANDVLGKASLLDKPKVIELALRLGADIEARDQKGRTALLVAVEEVHNAAIKVLLSKGASTDVVCSSGRRGDILQIAVESQRIFDERLTMILNCQSPYPVTSGILPRSSRANEKVWDELLKVFRARPLSWMSQELFEALHEDRANQDIIRTLLDYGADSAIKTQDGQTLLHLAICSPWRLGTLLQWARQNMATALNVNVKDAMGRTALHYAAAAANPAAMVTLLAYGADINAKDANKVTVLHFSVETHDCIERALESGAEVDATDSSGRSALHYLIMLTGDPKLDKLSNWQRTYNVPGPNKDARDANGNKTKAHYMAIPRECDKRCLNLFAAAYARLGPHDDPADKYGMRVEDYVFATKAAQRNFEGTISWLSEMKQRYRFQRAVIYKTIEHVRHEARLNSETWTFDMDEYYGAHKRWRTDGDDEVQETLSTQGPLSNRVMTFQGKKPEVLDSSVILLVAQD